MTRKFNAFAAGLGFMTLAGVVQAQYVISAHSGTIQYTEGRVLLNDKVFESNGSTFTEVKQDQVLRTEDGRAEVLLTPGAVLRLTEDSSFRMVSNKLADTRIEALTGTVLVTLPEMLADNAITLLYKDRTISLVKKGNYRLDAADGQLRVYEGEAKIAANGQTVTAGNARKVDLNNQVLAADKFDAKSGDEFYRWAGRRDSYLAMANMSAAKSAYDLGYGNSYSSGWVWNPWFNSFTFLPGGGMFMSPFGYSYWSPAFYGVNGFYLYNPYYFGGGGYVPVSSGGSTATAYTGSRYSSPTGYNGAYRPIGVGSATISHPSYSAAGSGSFGGGGPISSGGGAPAGGGGFSGGGGRPGGGAGGGRGR